MYNHISKIVFSAISIIQASGLRNRVYAMEDRLDILEVALEDIKRINANSASPNTLISTICDNVDKHKVSVQDYIP